MTEHIVIDAGPTLNFLSHGRDIGKLIFLVFGSVHMPETVVSEVQWKHKRNSAFSEAPRRLNDIIDSSKQLIKVLDDSEGAEAGALAKAVSDLCDKDILARKKQPQDLGETMCIAWAMVYIRQGIDVTLIVDDGGAHELVRRARERLGADPTIPGVSHGRLKVMGTLDVLELAIEQGHIGSKQTLRDMYGKMSPHDGGLPNDIGQTKLLDKALWPPEGRGQAAS